MNENWRKITLPILKEENYRCSNSWTSISDIGRIFSGHEFTYEDYLKTEQSYIRFFVSLFEYLHAQKIKLIQLEIYDYSFSVSNKEENELFRIWHNKVKNNMSLSLDNLQYVVPLILRENIWGTLYHKRTRTYIRFGYDYYVYVNSPVFYSSNGGKVYFNTDIERLASENKLFVEYDYTPTLQKIGSLIK